MLLAFLSFAASTIRIYGETTAFTGFYGGDFTGAAAKGQGRCARGTRTAIARRLPTAYVKELSRSLDTILNGETSMSMEFYGSPRGGRRPFHI